MMGTPIYDASHPYGQSANPNPPAANVTPDLQAIVDAAIAKDRESRDGELARLRADFDALRTAGAAVSNIAFNGAGIGTEIAETWSQLDQDLANRGEHPLQRK